MASSSRFVQVSKPNGPFEIVDRYIPEPSATLVRINVEECDVCHSDSFTKEGYSLASNIKGFLAMKLQGLL
jgi:D-arabinose 1-dehydrogenase-like Zn-dependent alcohol dehydrogenase